MIWAFRARQWVGGIRELFLIRESLVFEGTWNLRSGKIRKNYECVFFERVGWVIFVHVEFHGELLRLNFVNVVIRTRLNGSHVPAP